jgi:hypothetical protein
VILDFAPQYAVAHHHPARRNTELDPTFRAKLLQNFFALDKGSPVRLLPLELSKSKT